MAPTNDFLPFCPTDTGTNLLTEADYTAAADRVSGNKPGVASSKLNNKALRQANAVVSQLAQFVSNTTSTDVLDDGIAAKLLAQITAALTAYPPNFTKYVSGSNTFNLSYIFHIVTGSATSGATYTNNGNTYTVKATVASGVVLKASGPGAPTASGTLTKASGSGDATLTFYAVRTPIYLKVRAVGGGGGGGGGAHTAAATDGGTGGDTTFGSTIVVAGGGTGGGGGRNSRIPGLGGSASLGAGAVGTIIAGSSGSGQFAADGSAGPPLNSGGTGGASFFGGGAGSPFDQGGINGATNSGAGGGGGTGSGGSTALENGCGGGSGGFAEALIASPASTYTVVVGAAGTGGALGTTGDHAGGDGGSGYAEIMEFYQ